MKKLYEDLERYKSKLIAEKKDEAQSQSSDELRRIVAQSMEEGYDDQDEGMGEGTYEKGDHDEEMEAPKDDFDQTLRELEEELGLHDKEDDADGEYYTQESQMQSEGDMEDGSDDDEEAIKMAIADLTEMDEMEIVTEEDDLAKEIEAALAQAEGGDPEMGDEEDGEMDEIAKMQMEADQILDDISEDVEAELAKALEKDEDEMDENMSISHTNGRGENKKPQPEFAHDQSELMRKEALGKVKKAYESKIAKLTKLAETQNRQLKITAATAKKLAVFNENLMGITRLMIENAMTSKQKRAVVEQVMSSDPKTIQESKALIDTIKRGLFSEAKKPSTNASAVNKDKGSEKSLKESKAYEDPIFGRMVELTKYDYKK